MIWKKFGIILSMLNSEFNQMNIQYF